MITRKNGITAERLRALLIYDEVSGLFRRRTISKYHSRSRDICGSVSPDGYRTIYVDGARYVAHRLAFLYMTGRWPTHDIDHADGIRDNNRWSNLREATRSQNNANCRRRSNCKSGKKGVIWDRSMKQWRAQMTVDRKTIYLSWFDSIDDAHAAYCTAARHYHGEFARAA